MKRKNPITLLGAWLALALILAEPARAADGRALTGASQHAGTVSGRVSNQATQDYLEGARVTLQPSGQSTLTGRDGSFILTNVPPGSYTISVAYTGLDTQSLTATVEAGRAEVKDVALTSGIYVLDKFVVPGEREGNALAVTQQRNAPNVKNVISSDAFGIIADENIGNFLQRVPGVAMTEQDGSQLFVKIRGIDANLNAVTVDGTRQPGGGARGGLTRSFELDTVPAEFIETIEVTKAPTPDMDADSIGGSVNLKTKSAFDRKGRLITYRVGGSYTFDGGTWGQLGNFMYSDLLGADQRLGVMITASYDKTQRARDVSLIDGWERTADLDRPLYFYLTSHGEDAFKNKRGGAGLRLDYKLGSRTTIYGSAMYSYFADWMHRRRAVFNQVQTRIVARIDANGVPRAADGQTASILPGFTGPPGGGLVTETIGGGFQFNEVWRDRDKKTWNYQAGGKTLFDAAELDYNLNFAKSDGTLDSYTAQPTVSNVGFRFDRSNARMGSLAEWEQISGPDVRNPANWAFSAFPVNFDSQSDRILGAQANFRKSFDLAVPAYIKTGLRYRKQEPKQYFDRRTNTYIGPNKLKFAEAGDAASINPDLKFFNMPMIIEEYNSTPANFVENKVSTLTNKLNNDKEASESVGAAYIMGGVQLNKLGILAGLRVEETRVKGAGNVVDLTPVERARRAAWVGPVTEDENLRRIQAERGNFRRSSASYRNVFPGVHFRYEPREGWVGRASYSTGIGRPNFSTIIPGDSVNHDTELVTANNAALKPQWADNFDVSLEYYYEPAGLISAGVFLKEISDFIFTSDVGYIPSGADNGFNGNYDGYRLRTQTNGGYARVRGLELNFQHRFSRLPGFWNGFAVFANHTWLESIGDYGTIGQTRTQGQIPGFVPRTASFGISYINQKWTIRTLTTYRGANPQVIGTNPLAQEFNRSRVPTDLSVSYTISPKYTLFMNVANVFASELTGSYLYHTLRPINKDGWQQHIKFGISGRL